MSLQKAMLWAAGLVVVGFVSTAAPARAQFRCVAFGVEVPRFPSDQVNDIAVAALLPNGSPVIWYNPRVVAATPYDVQVFFFFHECAHHARGHVLGRAYPPSAERDADCFAAWWLTHHLGWTRDRLLRLMQYMATSLGPGDWSHLPGGYRAIDVGQCGSMGGTGSQPRRRGRYAPPEDGEPEPEGRRSAYGRCHDRCRGDYDACRDSGRASRRCSDDREDCYDDCAERHDRSR